VPPLFILSTGRTGTTWLASVFAHAGARAVHEPAPRWLRMVGNAHAAGALSRARATEIVSRVRSDAVTPRAPETRPYVEANSLVSGLAGPLLDAFGDARVVQVVRDPVGYVSSALAWGQYRLAGRVLNVVPYRRLAAPQFRPWSPAERLRWVGRAQFDRLCWTWMAQNRAMRTQGEGNPRFSTVRFEDLVDRDGGRATVRQLFDLAGLAGNVDAAIAAADAMRNESAPRAAKVTLDRVQRELLGAVCRDEAARYGYVV
jgi:hypothetical protein